LKKSSNPGLQRYVPLCNLGPNLAARSCGEAKDGQILIAPRVLAKIEEQIEVEALGEFMLKGFHRPVLAYNILSIRQDASAQMSSIAADGVASAPIGSATMAPPP
jgi:hypothetical protein